MNFKEKIVESQIQIRNSGNNYLYMAIFSFC